MQIRCWERRWDLSLNIVYFGAYLKKDMNEREEDQKKRLLGSDLSSRKHVLCWKIEMFVLYKTTYKRKIKGVAEYVLKNKHKNSV